MHYSLVYMETCLMEQDDHELAKDSSKAAAVAMRGKGPSFVLKALATDYNLLRGAALAAAMRSQRAVSAHFLSKQLLPSALLSHAVLRELPGLSFLTYPLSPTCIMFSFCLGDAIFPCVSCRPILCFQLPAACSLSPACWHLLKAAYRR